MILLIDNYDSFSYNLYQLIGEIEPQIKVIRNDEMTVEEISKLSPDRIILSPGPGRPEDAGVIIDCVKELGGEIPILGVCLGDQAIKAFNVTDESDISLALKSTADFVLLDSPLAGSGTRFDWKLLKKFGRPYFLAGGLNTDNVFGAMLSLHPYAADISSGIETDGVKDFDKMKRFAAVRELKGT